MDEVFKHPPATLQDTFISLRDRLCVFRPLTYEETVLVRSAAAYVYVAAVGRLTAVIPASDGLPTCNENKVALQVLGEALQVLQEVKQFQSNEATQERRFDA